MDELVFVLNGWIDLSVHTHYVIHCSNRNNTSALRNESKVLKKEEKIRYLDLV